MLFKQPLILYHNPIERPMVVCAIVVPISVALLKRS